MIQLTLHEVDDLKHCLRKLEIVLKTLDAAGAGIAAIHVNAAIEQLKKNLASVDPQAPLNRGAFIFPEEND